MGSLEEATWAAPRTWEAEAIMEPRATKAKSHQNTSHPGPNPVGGNVAPQMMPDTKRTVEAKLDKETTSNLKT